MKLKLKKHSQEVDATIDAEYGIIVAACYTDTGILLDEVELLELELEYNDLINEVLYE
jgi:hypothetical protein